MNDRTLTREGTDPPRRAARWARPVSWLIGVGLVAIAAWAVARSGVDLASLGRTVRAAPAGSLAALVALIVLTPLCSSAMFWVLTRRYAAVPFGENTALTLAAWLLNYLPMAPGLFGRLAYLRSVHGVPIRHSARVVIWANVLSLLAATGLLLTLAAAAAVTRTGPALGVLTILPAVALGAFAWYARVKRPRPDPEVWRLIAALAVRWVELHLWAARSWVVFDLVGTPIGWGGALALSGVAGVAVLIPITPNALGVREWAVALAAPLLPASFAFTVGLTPAAGLSAELVHRGFELGVAVPLGLLSGGVVAMRLRRHRAGTVAAPTDPATL